jgi:hypothetical protein
MSLFTKPYASAEGRLVVHPARRLYELLTWNWASSIPCA